MQFNNVFLVLMAVNYTTNTANTICLYMYQHPVCLFHSGSHSYNNYSLMTRGAAAPPLPTLNTLPPPHSLHHHYVQVVFLSAKRLDKI
jgi:hypothetical protein